MKINKLRWMGIAVAVVATLNISNAIAFGDKKAEGEKAKTELLDKKSDAKFDKSALKVKAEAKKKALHAKAEKTKVDAKEAKTKKESDN